MKKRKDHTDRIWQAGMVFALLLLLCGCTRKEEVLLLSEETAEAENQAVFPEDTGKEAYLEAQEGVIYVHVCGAVVHPGVYELEAGSRVYEAVGLAGGFAENADQNYVNQAQPLEDGVRLVIPTKEEAANAREQETAAAAGEAPDGRVNINTASEAQLCEIPGVGATRAAAIAAYRETNGAFEKPEDIMKVNGIKEGMYEKIKDSIRVN